MARYIFSEHYDLDRIYDMLQTKTYKEVSEELGVGISTIQMNLFRHGYIKPKKERPKDRTCPVCGALFGGDKRKVYCSKQCTSIACRGQGGERISNAARIDSDITLLKLFNRDNGICYICGCKTSFDDKLSSNRGHTICGKTYPSIDHIIPLSKGGSHSWDNVKLACLHCNQSKGSKVRKEVV